MNNVPIHVGIACDDNYSPHAGVVIASVLASANVDDHLFFHVLDGGISEENKSKLVSLASIRECQIDIIPIDEGLFEDYKKVQTHSYLSIATFYRLKLGSILPQVARIIYLDCDVVVNCSFHELAELDLQGNVVAGVLDIANQRHNRKPNLAVGSIYVNGGMLLMDLDRIRQEGLESEFLKYTQEHIDEIFIGDQQIINKVLEGKIKELPSIWNVQSSNFVNRSDYTENPKLIHYIGAQKPWKKGAWNYYKRYYYRYLQLTPWRIADDEIEGFRKRERYSAAWGFLKYRPFNCFRPMFYKALYYFIMRRWCSPGGIWTNDNTFIVWEPCSHSHAVVVPGYVKYLRDLGYSVSVVANPKEFKNGLFCRIDDPQIHLNSMPIYLARRFFHWCGLSPAKGIMVTTVGKISKGENYLDAYDFFKCDTTAQKILLVEHEIKHTADVGSLTPEIITLRQMNYRDAKTTIISPHYFGKVAITPKNSDVINFITVGAVQAKKKNNNLIIESVLELHNRGIRNFKVTVIGKGKLSNLPKEARAYFDIKGRLSFRELYEEMEQADYLLTAYNSASPCHIRYNTTGTSGNFLLSYGFGKPCVLVRDFAKINGFDDDNCVLYDTDADYVDALVRAIKMSDSDYLKTQAALLKYANELYSLSLANLRGLLQ